MRQSVMETLRLSVRDVVLPVARLRPAYKCIIVLCAMALGLVVSRAVEFMIMDEQPIVAKSSPGGLPPDPTPIPLSWFESVQDSLGVSDYCEASPTPVELYSDFLKHTAVQQDYAYVTYVSSREYVQGAAVLMHSVAMTGSRHARAVLVTTDISQRDRDLLSTLAQVIEIERVAHTHHIGHHAYRDTFTKLRIWELTMFTKVVYIDVDVVLLRNIDDLFDLAEWAVPMDGEQARYSTGMMVCEPSLKTFDDMMVRLKKTRVSMELPDLNFLKEYFDNYNRNALLAARNRTANAGNTTGNGRNSTRRIVKGADTTGKRINIIPRWYQVYQSQFREDVRSYLTANQHSITIYDHRVHGIHYPGMAKPWLRFASRWVLYRRRFCTWSNAEEFKHNPDFLWYVHCAWMQSTLRRFRDDVAFDSQFDAAPFELELKKWVAKKKSEEADWKPALPSRRRQQQNQTVQPPPAQRRRTPGANSSQTGTSRSREPVPTL